MAAPDVLQTYQSIGNREDLLDVISNISPTETPMFSSFKKSKASATYHEWLTDSLASATTNYAVEGASYSYSPLTPRVRTGNYTQILTKTFQVSGTQEVVNKAGVGSEYSYQAEKAMKELARDIEYAIVNGTSASGASATARTLRGVVNWITTNIDSATGSALTETRYNDMLQTIYNSGGNPNVTYANGWQKRKISAFTTPSTRNIDAEGKKLVVAVDVYESDFGLQKIILDRYMPTDTIVLLEQDKWGVATLRPIKVEETPKTADARNGAITAELTLVSSNEAASGKISGLTTS